MIMNVTQLDEGQGISETLESHKASWHKSRFKKCPNLELQRTQKHKSEQTTVVISPVKTRSVVGAATLDVSESAKLYFFVMKLVEDYKNVKRSATELQDTRLLAKSSTGKICMQVIHTPIETVSLLCITKLEV